MRRPRPWLVYAATLLSTASYMITFNHPARLLIHVRSAISGVPGRVRSTLAPTARHP